MQYKDSIVDVEETFRFKLDRSAFIDIDKQELSFKAFIITDNNFKVQIDSSLTN